MRATELLYLGALAAVALAGCAEPKAEDDDEDGGLQPGADSADSGGGELVCEPPAASACGNDASVIRGEVALDPSLAGAAASGTLFLALTHYRLGGGNEGGYYHISTEIPGVDLAAGPVPFELDMCLGGAMWSEENCEYNLIAILDQGGDNGPTNLLPAAGEPAARVEGVTLSCAADPLCLYVTLDCVDGPSCATFSDPGTCSCAPASCDSDYTTCQ